MKKTVVFFLVIAILICALSSCACKHDFAPATCTKPATCSKCGETQGEALGHSFNAATCTVPAACTKCGITQGTALGHTTTCASDSPCTRCGEMVAHNYKGNAKTGIISCLACSAKVDYSTIHGKPIEELSYVEKAYVSWTINNYMTAVDRNGRYLYTEQEAYSNSAYDLGYTYSEMVSFWKNHTGTSAWMHYYSK